MRFAVTLILNTLIIETKFRSKTGEAFSLILKPPKMELYRLF